MAIKREFDVVIWGATGFTGRLVAEYYQKRYPGGKDLKWAMAGRNAEKIIEVQEKTGTYDVPYIVANSNNKASLDEMTKRTKVICTTVGPYAKYGSDLVASCVENGTHYCDLAGEVQWIRKMIDLHHDEAEKNKVKITHCCGFDSVPSDLGVFFFQNEIKNKTGSFAKEIKFFVKAMSGTFSGGTLASLQNVMAEAAEDKSIFKVLLNPYGLNPEGERSGPDKKDLIKPKKDKDVCAWVGPFVMAAINTKVVRRSNALANYPYGKDFLYSETMLTGKGIKGRMGATSLMMTMGIASAMKPGSILKKIGDRFLPQPGEGPSKEQRENGFFNILLLGKMEDGTIYKAKVTGDKDPGYGSTSKMLGEAAVSLAKDDLPETYGCLTPTVAMGDKFLERLKSKAGLTFEMT